MFQQKRQLNKTIEREKTKLIQKVNALYITICIHKTPNSCKIYLSRKTARIHIYNIYVEAVPRYNFRRFSFMQFVLQQILYTNK